MEFTVDLKDKQKASPILYGLFFEDINHSLDGGLNANLIQNGNFEFSYFNYNSLDVTRIFDHLRFWSCEPQKLISISDKKPIHANNPHSLNVKLGIGDGDVVLKNFGYEVKNNNNYLFLNDKVFMCSFFYCADNDFSMQCYFEYENGTTSKPTTILLSKSKDYKLIEFDLKGKKDSFARLVFKVHGQVDAYFTNFRLIPQNYFKSTKNQYKFGKFNASLVKSLDIGAKFLRFPGGCLVEGDVCPDYLYEWEKTIGPVQTRISKPSVWNYMQSNEIGFFEYFCLCEDLKLLPVPVHHVGLNCQIRTEVFRHSGYKAYHPASKEFKRNVIDSIAHLIYFAKGDVNSTDEVEREWANKRKSMGHTKPFKLSLVAVGNENWDKIYFRNFNAAVKGLKNYIYNGTPTDILNRFAVTLITSAGVDINPQDTNPSWRYITKNYKDLIVDEHVYNTPTWFIDNFYRYDFYNPSESKVFMGEYACHTDADGKGLLGGKNNFTSALAESVFMCGMENNPGIVKMSCYAPLLVKKFQANWNPDLIIFDKDKIEFTPNYYTQKLFMQNYGQYVIKPKTEQSKTIRGNFAIKKYDNTLKNIEFKSTHQNLLHVQLDKNGESDRELENYFVNIKFDEKPTNFTISFAINKREGFSFNLHYDRANRSLFFEKIVNNLRMTMEWLCNVDFAQSVSVLFDSQKIVVFNGKKEVASKNIWKNNQSVFASATFDKHQVYVKLINISQAKQDVQIDFDKALLKQIKGKHIWLSEGQTEFACVEKSKQIKGNDSSLKITLLPRTINILLLQRI